MISIYEDADLVREMRFIDAMEEETMNMMSHTFVPAGFEALIDNIAAANAKPLPKKRVTLLGVARKALEEGVLPEAPTITSLANTSYNTHLARLRAFAQDGLRTAVEDYPIAGTNTYARMVRGYRDLLLEYLDKASSAKSGAATHVPTAQPATPAKKVSAHKHTAAKTKATKPVTTTKAAAKPAKARKAPAKKK